VIEDIKLVVDQDLSQTYGVFNIDYANDWLRKGFSITADGSSGSC